MTGETVEQLKDRLRKDDEAKEKAFQKRLEQLRGTRRSTAPRRKQRNGPSSKSVRGSWRVSGRAGSGR